MVLSPVNFLNLASDFDVKSSEKDGLTLSFSAGFKALLAWFWRYWHNGVAPGMTFSG
jgi:hypothetical protein